MKGIVLAGGLGTRLYPLTKITNKHLLPVYDRPMVYYPIQTLAKSGISEAMIVTGGRHVGDFLKLLKNGYEIGLKSLQYTYQEKEGGIGEALSLCEEFIGGESMFVILGDNVVEQNFTSQVQLFENKNSNCKIFLTPVENPTEYGIAEIKDNVITNITEKPNFPKTNLAVTGIYLFTPDVFDVIRQQSYSDRGELEITDVIKYYLQHNALEHEFLNGYWLDAGESIKAYNNAIQVIKSKK